ncbi:hypothetical protein GXM_00427 [Nostoc sphaeroides CCNUC1]|uniref:Uncharacterized protein n=1 Tax=Nostoc sphaeroides CCNUC1 TaxID=2653204 RepID=A0A5P8VRN8_9NOSO|nr:hypothetical protein GXM_00427 [Nostoc sphaeroides CCNUC1]
MNNSNGIFFYLEVPNNQCPMPYAQCPMPHSQCLMLNEYQSFCFFPDCINFIRKQLR